MLEIFSLSKIFTKILHINFSVVILSNDLDRQYDIIMDENCIEACLESLENGISRLMKSGSNLSFSEDEKKENMKQSISSSYPHVDTI